MNRIGSYTFSIEAGDVDIFGKYPLPVIVRKMLDCAGYHADERGWGLRNLNAENCSWVLARAAIELESLPEIYDKIVIQTWVEDLNKHFSTRNFCFQNQKGEILGYARTVWSMINLNTRKVVDLTAVSDISNHKADKECPIEKPGKIGIVSSEPEYFHDVKYSDLDINGHVNTCKYVEHIINLFSSGIEQIVVLKRFDITFLSESKLGDKLHFHRATASDHETQIEITGDNSRSICRAKITFKK
jgi:Acyl-ACP thioesterase